MSIEKFLEKNKKTKVERPKKTLKEIEEELDKAWDELEEEELSEEQLELEEEFFEQDSI